MTKTDLFGNEVEQPSKQDRWNAVMEKLSKLNQLYAEEIKSAGFFDDEVLCIVDELLEAYNIWLD